MYRHLSLVAIGALLSLALRASADTNCYSDNCSGSVLDPSDCGAAIGNVDPSSTYSTGTTFSSGDCYMIYAGTGCPNASGSLIIATASQIDAGCGQYKGSYGTCNGAACHVTLNYQDPVK